MPRLDGGAERRRIWVLLHGRPNTDERVTRKELRTDYEGRLKDITEFGRAVHAEMEALLACMRIGVSPRGGTLYSTTFPCHNCAKHIVAAGIQRVVYVEPYPKSRALDLFSDSIRFQDDPSMSGTSLVRFEPFVGMAPRRFFDIFSLRLGHGQEIRRKAEGKMVEWRIESSYPRNELNHTSYLELEKIAAHQLVQLKQLFEAKND